jgi:dipeptidyl-peptidase-4
MKTSIGILCLVSIGLVGTVVAPDVRAQTSRESLFKETESRLRAIYDRDEFRPKRFRGDWLSDSSGYTVSESVPDAKEQVLARYDVASGKRTVLDSPQRPTADGSEDVSPDGRRVLLSEHGNLYVRDLSGG